MGFGSRTQIPGAALSRGVGRALGGPGCPPASLRTPLAEGAPAAVPAPCVPGPPPCGPGPQNLSGKGHLVPPRPQGQERGRPPAGLPWDQTSGQTGVPPRQAAENRPWERLSLSPSRLGRGRGRSGAEACAGPALGPRLCGCSAPVCRAGAHTFPHQAHLAAGRGGRPGGQGGARGEAGAPPPAPRSRTFPTAGWAAAVDSSEVTGPRPPPCWPRPACSPTGPRGA